MSSAFDAAVGETVRCLHGDDGRPTAKVGEEWCLRDNPRGRVGKPDVKHLPRAHQVIQAAA